MIAAFCNGIIYLLENILNKENLQSLTIWHFGSYRNLNSNQIILMLCIIFCCAIIIYLQSSKYNTYLLGDLYAEGLGLPLKKFLIQNLFITAIITATITAFCGPIGFIGLAVPHIAKILFKTNNHRILIPLTILAGVNISLCCHVISSLSIFGTNLPINAITSLIGAPITIWLILKLNNNYA